MIKLIFIIPIILLFLCSVAAYSQNPQPPPGQEKIKKKTDRAKNNISAKNDKEPSKNQTPIIVNKLHSDKNKPHPHHPSAKPNNKLKGADLWNVTNLFNFLLVVFTGALVICNIKLWKATKKSADAAKEASNAAKKSVDIIPAIERAYIYVSSVSADFESWRNVKVSQLSPISIEVRNYGRTPAKLVGITTKIQIGKSDGIKISWNTPDVEDIVDSVGRFIASDSKESFFYYMHSAIGDGDYYIIFSGEARYRDIFEKDHTAYFDWMLVSRNFERGFYINSPEKNYTT